MKRPAATLLGHDLRSTRTRASRIRRLALGALLALSPVTLTGCGQTPASTPASPSASYTPYTPTPPRAVDLRTATQALALQISAEGVAVDGLDCRTSGTQQAALHLRRIVTTGGGDGHPDQIAEATWNKPAGTVHLGSVQPAPSTPRPPIATARTTAAQDTDIPAAQITRVVRSALVKAEVVPASSSITCTDLHAGTAGCEVHADATTAQYFNVQRDDTTLNIYQARG